MNKNRQDRVSHIRFFAFFITVTYQLYGSSVDSWWSFDDTEILEYILIYNPIEYFLISGVWRELSANFFSPWLALSYDFDLNLFGLNPGGFYLHNLVAIAVGGWLVYYIIRSYSDNLYALGGGLLFISGAPIVTASHQLMIRHYVEGLIFFLLALLLYISALKNNKRGYALLSGIVFLFAFMAKEIYIPLSFSILFIPLVGLGQRIKTGIPIFIAVLVYFSWRYYMLETVIGGYQPTDALIGRLDLNNFKQFFLLPTIFWSPAIVGIFIISISILIKIWISRCFWKFVIFVVVVAISLLLPLIPLAAFGGINENVTRAFIGVWVACVFAFSIWPSSLRVSNIIWFRAIWAILLLAIIASTMSRSKEWNEILKSQNAEYAAYGKAILNLDDKAVIFSSPRLLTHFIPSLLVLRKSMNNNSNPPHVIADEYDLATFNITGKTVFQYYPEHQKFIDITGRVPAIISLWRTRLKSESMSVEIYYSGEDKALQWELGPEFDGVYSIVTKYGKSPIARKGSIRYNKTLTGCFYFRYDYLDGSVDYSPPLSLGDPDTKGNSALQWKRFGDKSINNQLPAINCKKLLHI